MTRGGRALAGGSGGGGIQFSIEVLAPNNLEPGGFKYALTLSQDILYSDELTLQGLQSRFGDKASKLQAVYPQNGTAVLKGLM